MSDARCGKKKGGAHVCMYTFHTRVHPLTPFLPRFTQTQTSPRTRTGDVRKQFPRVRPTCVLRIVSSRVKYVETSGWRRWYLLVLLSVIQREEIQPEGIDNEASSVA
jgi:hypothetical protein